MMKQGLGAALVPPVLRHCYRHPVVEGGHRASNMGASFRRRRGPHIISDTVASVDGFARRYSCLPGRASQLQAPADWQQC